MQKVAQDVVELLVDELFWPLDADDQSYECNSTVVGSVESEVVDQGT